MLCCLEEVRRYKKCGSHDGQLWHSNCKRIYVLHMTPYKNGQPQQVPPIELPQNIEWKISPTNMSCLNSCPPPSPSSLKLCSMHGLCHEMENYWNLAPPLKFPTMSFSFTAHWLTRLMYQGIFLKDKAWMRHDQKRAYFNKSKAIRRSNAPSLQI